jgi:hypothetical protein
VLAFAVAAETVRQNRRGALLASDHGDELRSIVVAGMERVAETGTTVIAASSRGVSIGASLELDAGCPELHVSFSLPGASDLELLCELAAQAAPSPDGQPRIGTGGVLHLRVPSPLGTVAGVRSGKQLYGDAVRLSQRPVCDGEAGGPVPQLRDAYFDRRAVPRAIGD